MLLKFWPAQRTKVPLLPLISCLLSTVAFLPVSFLLLGLYKASFQRKKFSGKAFMVLRLVWRSKCRWLVEQDFSITNFASTWHAWFCVLFSGLFDWIMLSWVWFERSLSPTQVRGQNNNYCLWLLHVIKTGEVTSSTRDLDPHKQLWVVQVSKEQKAAKIIGRFTRNILLKLIFIGILFFKGFFSRFHLLLEE